MLIFGRFGVERYSRRMQPAYLRSKQKYYLYPKCKMNYGLIDEWQMAVTSAASLCLPYNIGAAVIVYLAEALFAHACIG
jgi:hypothetical protein